MNENFIFQQIRRYNTARNDFYKNAALAAIGIHAELIEKKQLVARELTAEEKQRIIYFINQFCKEQGVQASVE